MTGILGTFFVLLGYLLLALRKEASWVLALGSLAWATHAVLRKDLWLFIMNAVTAILSLIAFVRFLRQKKSLS